MILRVPDYYFDFSCIADRCQDSCCIGWEIDIDEDTCDYYRQVPGEFGQKLKKQMYVTREGENSFRLAEKGRCPFLDSCNLCEIYSQLGEEALSEVCTEYPRFAVEYGNVLQKCLSLSCEEVGRLVFTREEPVTILEVEQPDYEFAQEDEAEMTEGEPEADSGIWYAHMEELQVQAMKILQDRTRSIEDRMKDYLLFLTGDDRSLPDDELPQADPESRSENSEAGKTAENRNGTHQDDYGDFCSRMEVFYEMETLDQEWRQVKKDFRQYYTAESYPRILENFRKSPDYRESDYEQLMVYFTFRYLMNAVYDYDVSSYARLAVVFTLALRDMDALRYYLNGGNFSRADRIDTARIFSKEVEHSEENVEMAREAFLFDDIFSVEALLLQI